MATVVKSKVSKSSQKTKAKKAAAKPVTTQVVKATAKKSLAVPVAEEVMKPAPNSAETKKQVSQKLLETIEKRKQMKAQNGFGKPPGRRGRRPKDMSEYTPENREEEAYVLESDYEGIEYDTGIRLKGGGEDRGFGVERFEEFDEELNFDW